MQGVPLVTPLEMIAEWRRGCSCGPKEAPEKCEECTRALIDALERKLRATAEFHELSEQVERQREALLLIGRTLFKRPVTQGEVDSVGRRVVELLGNPA